jgi:hypothetical protein
LTPSLSEKPELRLKQKKTKQNKTQNKTKQKTNKPFGQEMHLNTAYMPGFKKTGLEKWLGNFNSL